MSDQIMDASQAKIEAMEAKILELEAKLQELAKMAGEEISEGKEALLENIKNGAERLYKDLTPFVEKYKEERDQAMRAAGTKICEHPFISVAAAFGAGLLIARLLENKVCHGGHFHRS